MSTRRAIVLHTGGIVFDKGSWRTLRLGEGENGGFCNDYLRVAAAAELRHILQCPIIVCGGLRNNYKDASEPTTAEVNKRELVKLGVPSESIIEEGLSFNTYHDLLWLHGWAVGDGTKEMHLLSNDWHIPRIMAMIVYAPCLRQMCKGGISYIPAPAEEILLKADRKRWEPEINAARRHPGYAERVRLEEAGIKKIMAGTYKFG